VGQRLKLTRRRLIGLIAALPLAGCAGARPVPTATPPPIIGPDVAALRVGQDVRVRMQVACADFGGATTPTYLRPTCYFDGFYFRLAIPPEKRELFTKTVGGPPEVQLVDKVVDARGAVQKNGTWSEIVLQAPDQVKVATGWSPPKVPTRVPTPKTGG
jgi:hypothetical protein